MTRSGRGGDGLTEVQVDRTTSSAAVNDNVLTEGANAAFQINSVRRDRDCACFSSQQFGAAQSEGEGSGASGGVGLIEGVDGHTSVNSDVPGLIDRHHIQLVGVTNNSIESDVTQTAGGRQIAGRNSVTVQGAAELNRAD